MARRSKQRTALVLESLESRQVLSSAAPTAELQYSLELINLTRTNPAAAVDRLTANLSESTKSTLDFYGVDLAQAKREVAAAQPRQPLAWSDELARAAQQHSQDMADNGYQSHTGSDGSSPSDRIISNGYTDSIRSAENAFAYSESIDQAMQAFVLDWGVADKGHRRNLLEPDNGGDDSFKEVGVGVVQSKRIGMGKVVTQNFGVRRSVGAQLLGVAYDDKDHNGFYSIGEGQGGVTLQITGADGSSATVQTADPGGYQVPLKPGTYSVKATLNGREVANNTVRIGTKNVKLDIVLNDAQITPQTNPPRTVRTVNTTPSNNTNRVTTTVPIVTKPTTTPVTVVTPTITSQPAPVNTTTPVTVLSNLTSPTPSPKTEVDPTPVTFSNVGGFTWNSWKAIPKS
jgi:uncharacterized protein YkwD